MTGTTAVTTSIVVDAPADQAFAVFTEDIGSWWPGPSGDGGSSRNYLRFGDRLFGVRYG